MHRVSLVALAVVLGLSSPLAAAENHGTADEAKTLVQKAVAYIKANGKEAAFATISKPDPQFVDRDLYIFVQDMKGVNVAHAANPKMVGKDMSEVPDTDGKFYVKERIALAKAQKSFWSDYKFSNPMTKKVEPKSTYCEVLDDFMVCSGIYK